MATIEKEQIIRQIIEQSNSILGVPPECSALECFRMGYREGAKYGYNLALEKFIEIIEDSIDLNENMEKIIGTLKRN
jgi:hypothetical protein